MPLDAFEAVLKAASFMAMGTINTVAVNEGGLLPRAMDLVEAAVRLVDQTCSRFKPESELSRLNRAAGKRTRISPLLEEGLEAALRAAEMSDGLVDPTVGAHVEEIGYTLTFGAMPLDGPPLELRTRRVVGWRCVELDRVAHTARIPAGTSLDLGASGKAWAADRAASAAATELGVGVLVECGGDVAVSGAAPTGGWPVRVASEAGASEGQDISLNDGGLATSGTTSRRWRRGGVEVHDIIDPATGLPAATPWAMVSVAAASCLEANAAATAALILGTGAPEWLERLGLPARLVGAGGEVRYTGGWSAGR